jgi:hypothetical protein
MTCSMEQLEQLEQQVVLRSLALRLHLALPWRPLKGPEVSPPQASPRCVSRAAEAFE